MNPSFLLVAALTVSSVRLSSPACHAPDRSSRRWLRRLQGGERGVHDKDTESEAWPRTFAFDCLGVRNLYCDLTKAKETSDTSAVASKSLLEERKLTLREADRLVKMERSRQYILKYLVNWDSINMSFPEPNTMKVGRKQDDSVKAGKRRRMARVMRINANSSFEVQGAGSWLYESRLSTFSALIEAAGNSNLSKPGAFRKANSTKGAIGDKGPIELNQNNLQYEYSLPLYRLDIASLKEKYRKIFNTWTHSSDRYYLAAKIRAGLKHQSRGSKLTPGDSIWRLGNGTHDVRRGGRMFRTNDGRNLYIANRSGYKGVRVPRRQPRKGKMSYEAHLSYLNREIHLGKFATAEEAARAYDRANLKARGRYAFTNFPAEDYDLDRICGPETERERVENDLDQQLLFQMRCAEHLVRISMKLAGNNCGNLLPKHRLTRIVGAAKYRLGLSYLRNSQSVTISRGNGLV